MKNKKAFHIFLVLAIILTTNLISCGKEKQKPELNPPNLTYGENESNYKNKASSNESFEHPTLDEVLPLPIYHDRKLFVFTDWGIIAFYRLHKRVPTSFDEYLESGIPMIIPKDYLSGKPYTLVNEINYNDTSGFTFETDGVETCKFQFVIKNDKTGAYEIRSFAKDKGSWNDYKQSDDKEGLFARNIYNFDNVKSEYCMSFFAEYSAAYMEEHKKAPSSLAEMFKGEGQLIEKGWQWMPVKTNGKTAYFEFGIDAEKERMYLILGCKGNCAPLRISIQQLYTDILTQDSDLVEGENIWHFTSDDVIPPDIITMNKFISSDSFYNGYLKIIGQDKNK